ncbi:VOC family protein [Desulfobacula sp.]|uniref:VOC family protein n=1 Tax=Desulfobacula sp. TaxID=2593537 RepID=UPI0026320666|nr:VOC family protein [Desulfobacula sp.]
MTLPHVDHIGIIVEDLEKSVTLFESLFGLSSSEIKEMDNVGLKIATLKAENIDIELIQYMEGKNNFGKDVMGERPGVNHFSIKTANVDAAVLAFEKKGLSVMEGFPRTGSHGSVAFFKKETTQNILMEICSDV